jgi:hypothetical protein
MSWEIITLTLLAMLLLAAVPLFFYRLAVYLTSSGRRPTHGNGMSAKLSRYSKRLTSLVPQRTTVHSEDGQGLVGAGARGLLPGGSRPVQNIYDKSGQELVQIEPMEEPEFRSKGRAHRLIPKGMTRHLSPLLEALPGSARLAAGASTETFKVVLRPELQQGLRDGTYEMMRSREVAGAIRANVVNKANGRIRGQGNLIRIGRARQLAALGFNVASLVTAQAHLAEINKKLAEISKGVEDINRHLKNQQEGALVGKMEYLSQLASQLLEGIPSETDTKEINSQLETIERESLEVIGALRKEREQREEELESLNLEKVFSTATTDAKQLTECAGRGASVVRRFQIALWVRLAAVELKSMLPVDQSIVEVRRRSIEQEIKDLRGHVQSHRGRYTERVKEITGVVRKLMSGSWSLKELRKETREEIASSFRPVQETLDEMKQTTKAGKVHAGKRQARLEEGCAIAVRRTSDGTVEAYLLEDE